MSGDETPEVDWSLATFEGARLEQLRRWSELSLREIVAALEEMQAIALALGNPDALTPDPFAGEGPLPGGSPDQGERDDGVTRGTRSR